MQQRRKLVTRVGLKCIFLMFLNIAARYSQQHELMSNYICLEVICK